MVETPGGGAARVSLASVSHVTHVWHARGSHEGTGRRVEERRAAAECQRSFYACVARPSVLVRERPCAVASVISLRFSARHTDAARPRGQQVGHALAPRHLLGVGRVELPKACRVNAQGRGDHRAATLVGPIRAPPPTPGAAGNPWLHRVVVRGARRARHERPGWRGWDGGCATGCQEQSL